MTAYPERKRNRLQNMLYNENGAYFVTICTRDKLNYFWNTVLDSHQPRVGAALRRPPEDTASTDAGPHSVSGKPSVGAALRRPPEPLNSNGCIVQREIDKFDAIYQGIVTVDNYVIMPNHVHLLLSIHSERAGGRRNAAPTISSVVNQFKGSVSKAIGFSCWQKSFHDHIVRDEREYLQIWAYIDANPGKWEEDRYYISIDR